MGLQGRTSSEGLLVAAVRWFTNRPSGWRRAALQSAALGSALALAWWLLQEVQLSSWPDALARVPLIWWPVATLAWLGGYAVRARRLQQEWAHRAIVPWGRCLALVLQHNAAVLLMPMRLGEAGYVVGVVRQWGVGLAEAGLSLFRMRVQDAVVLGLLGLAWLVPGGALMAASLVLLVFLVRWRVLRRRPVSQGTGVRLQTVLTSAGWGWSVLNWTLRLAVLGGWLVILSSSQPSVAIGIAVGAETGALWPLQGPAGLGPFEAGAWAAAAWLGDVPPGLVNAALMAHLFCVVVALSAAAWSLWVKPGPTRAR